MGKTANLELNTTEMSDKISDFVGEYNSNMNMLDDLYGDVQDDASSALSTAQSAETKATAAQTAATNAVTTANSANTTAQSAVSTANSANTTAGQANTKADNAVATANTAKTTADEAKETAETASADVADKADVDGTYDSFTAGGAKQLLSTVYVDDNEPYNFRTAGGSADIGDRMYEEVVGGSIVWNSMVDDGNLTNASRWNARQGTVTVADNVATVTATTTGTQTGLTSNGRNVGAAVKGHKYLAWADVLSPITGTCRISWSGGVTGATPKPVTANVWTNVASVFIRPDNNYEYATKCYVLIDQSIEAGQTIQFKKLFGCDLTQMFGSTIADYIYSLEQGTAGAGVAWFRKLFPKPYYEYNAGELMSVKAGSHDTVGFNLTAVDFAYLAASKTVPIDYDKAIRVIKGQTYEMCFESVSNATTWRMAVYCYDFDGNRVYTGSEITSSRLVGYTSSDYYVETTNGTRKNCTMTANFDGYVMPFIGIGDTGQGTVANNSCFHLVWDGERNGEYEPYESHEYPLANIELRGIPKLDANNQLYYDGDTYASDGTVTRRFGVIDFGDLDSTAFAYIESDNYSSWTYDGCRINVSGMNTNGNFFITNSAYMNVGFFNSWSTVPQQGDMVVGTSGAGVIFRNDSLTTAAAFKTALTGTYLVYELAELTTETADTFVSPQVVDDFGTEEYVDYAEQAGDRDVAIPVGHNSQYMNNLRAKLEMAPESPSGDGKYIVQQSNGENAYIPYTADGRLDALEAKVPAPPSANGTYKLTAVVSNNGVTYSWTT